MANTLMSLLVRIGADTSNLSGDLNKAESMALGSAKKINAGIGGLAATIGKGIGVVAVAGLAKATAGAVALGKGLQFAIGEAAAAQDIQAQLNAVLKSTNNAAGMTALEINALANQYSALTKFEDDAIVSGQNMLLTFTQIGKDVFPDATKTMLDMSTALGQDLQSSAMQLGKALNDPVAGVTALQRVGVKFTESQKKMIKEMVATGDVMGAQRLILKELNIEFGGSAEAAGRTAAGVWSRFKNAIGNIAETIGGPFLNAFTDIGNKIMPELAKLGEWFEDFDMKPFANAVVGGLGKAISWIIKVVPKAMTTLRDWFLKIEPIAARISENFKNVWLRMGRALAPFIEWAKKTLVPLFQRIKTKIQSSIGPLITFFTRVFNTIADFIKQKTPAFIAFADKVKAGFKKFTDFIIKNFPTLWGKISNVGLWIKDVADKAMLMFDAFRAGGLDALFAQFANGKSFIGEFLKALGVPEGTADKIGQVINDIYAWVSTNTPLIIAKVTEMKDGIVAAYEWVRTKLLEAQAWWVTHKDSIIGTLTILKDNVSTVWTELTSGLSAIWDLWTTNFGIAVEAWKALFSGDWYTFGEKLREIWDNNWAFIADIIGASWPEFLANLEILKSNIMAWAATVDWGKIGLEFIKRLAIGMLGGLPILIAAIGKISGAIKQGLSGFLGIGSNTYKPPSSKKAFGGSVMAGTAYTVGEHGMETFVPRTNGRIIPNGETKGGNVQNITVNIQNPKREAAEDSVRKALRNLNYTGSAA